MWAALKTVSDSLADKMQLCWLMATTHCQNTNKTKLNNFLSICVVGSTAKNQTGFLYQFYYAFEAWSASTTSFSIDQMIAMTSIQKFKSLMHIIQI